MKSDNARKSIFSEAIFELRWGPQMLEIGEPLPTSNPNYQILLGRLFESLKKEYPFLEPLPASKAPEDITKGIVHYRFRKAQNQFPLIQVGPGVYTVNANESFKWLSFKEMVIKGVEHLYKSYPDISDLKDITLVLTFVYADSFSFDSQNVIEYLKENLNLSISLNSKLLEGQKPKNLNLNLLIPSKKPTGNFSLLVAPGKKLNEDALVWHTTFKTEMSNLTGVPTNLNKWLDESCKFLTTWKG